ncbi:MAG TPA: hypothetical protein PK358_07075 [Spirochaetota bacterium]|nr:hypothetical protein [Spirochaetota bacterium]HPJ34581.1 hypothetical protein [Spirochaetota bacterium]
MKRVTEMMVVFLLAAGLISSFRAPLLSQEDQEFDDFFMDEPVSTLDITGFVENENIISTYTEQESAEISKKNEIRNNLKIRYGTEYFYLKIVSDQYVTAAPVNEEYRYSDSLSLGRNGRVSGEFYEINPRELYFNASFSRFRVRAGNQIYGWGTADVFNPTSYFNPYDLRELVFKDDNELKSGVPSLSTLVFLGDCTLELVYVPVHIPSLFAEQDDYWAFHYREGPFPVYVKNSEGMELSPGNSGYGARFGGTFSGIDSSVSGYYGPDRDPLLRPYRTVVEPNEPVSIEVVPEYYKTLYVGGDISMKFDRFTVQGEVSFSPNKKAVVDQSYTIDMDLPFVVTETKALSYSAGFNYYIPVSQFIKGHEGTAVFTAEWMQTVYYKEGLMKPFLTDILSCRVEDAYLGDRLKPSVTVVYDTAKKGLAVMPKVKWDFQNGFSVDVSYCYIRGRDGSVIGYFRDNDFISLRGRYAF